MYVKQSIYILFYRKLKKKNATTGLVIDPDHWNQESQKVLPASPEHKALNEEVGRIRTDLKRHFDLIQVQHEIATPGLVFKAYKTPLRAQKTREEQLENVAFSEALDELIGRYLVYQYKFEKAHAHGSTPHPTRAQLLATQQDALEKDLKKLVRRGNGLFDDPDWEKTVLLAVNEHLLHFMELAFAGERSSNTLEKMWGRKKRFIEFLQHRYETIDLPLKKVQYKFMDQRLTYNITEHGLIENSAMKYVQTLKEVFTRAVPIGWLPANIFDAFKCGYRKVDHDWLTMEELLELMTTDFAELGHPPLNVIRDIYVFSSFTGLSYAEVYSASPSDIIIGVDGKKWISKNRQKTDADETLPLLPVPLALIEKYKDHPLCVKRRKLLPVPCNVEYNRRLREIAALKGIKIVLRTHKARFFFANVVAFDNGIDARAMSLLTRFLFYPVTYHLRYPLCS